MVDELSISLKKHIKNKFPIGIYWPIKLASLVHVMGLLISCFAVGQMRGAVPMPAGVRCKTLKMKTGAIYTHNLA